MDEISKDVASKSPLISEPEPVENLKSEYTQNEGFLAKIEVCSLFGLITQGAVIRDICCVHSV